MNINTQRHSDAELSHRLGIEEARHNSIVYHVEDALDRRDSPQAKKILGERVAKLINDRQNETASSALVDFEEALDMYMYSAEDRPTDVSMTRATADVLEDKGLKAAYLHRMLGGWSSSEEEAKWSSLGTPDWRPIVNEDDRTFVLPSDVQSDQDWLFDQRLDLSQHPVAGVIDRIFDDRTRLIQFSARLSVDYVLAEAQQIAANIEALSSVIA